MKILFKVNAPPNALDKNTEDNIQLHLAAKGVRPVSESAVSRRCSSLLTRHFSYLFFFFFSGALAVTHLQCPVTENRQLCHLPVLPLQRYPCLPPSRGNLSVSIRPHGKSTYVPADGKKPSQGGLVSAASFCSFGLDTPPYMCLCVQKADRFGLLTSPTINFLLPLKRLPRAGIDFKANLSRYLFFSGSVHLCAANERVSSVPAE